MRISDWSSDVCSSDLMTIGMNKPFIVLNSRLVDLLDEEELRFVVAHELGHALSGHAVYQTLLQRLIPLTGVLQDRKSCRSGNGDTGRFAVRGRSCLKQKKTNT